MEVSKSKQTLADIILAPARERKSYIDMVAKRYNEQPTLGGLFFTVELLLGMLLMSLFSMYIASKLLELLAGTTESIPMLQRIMRFLSELLYLLPELIFGWLGGLVN